jgi:hypothetical protein
MCSLKFVKRWAIPEKKLVAYEKHFLSQCPRLMPSRVGQSYLQRFPKKQLRWIKWGSQDLGGDPMLTSGTFSGVVFKVMTLNWPYVRTYVAHLIENA